MKANLTLKASPTTLRPLTGPASDLEKAGREPTTSADELADRKGYNPDFLEGWSIPLPITSGAAVEDMRPLRRGGRGVELKYQNFSTVISIARRMPLLTAVNIDGSQTRKVPRISTWSYDGRLDKGDQWGDALYDSNALDRGHMVRREDPIWGTPGQAKIANEDTFHFTNSCPQMAGVNQVTWLSLEDYVLGNARADGMRVSVFTGPFFSEDDLEYRGALIPRAFWKVVAIVTEEGRPSATAYKVDQEKELGELEFVYAGFKTFQISVQQVIDGSGIDFGALVEYDGIGALEIATKQRIKEVITGPESIRI